MLEKSCEELLRGYREARCLVSVFNALHRIKIPLVNEEDTDGKRLGVRHLEALLALYELGKAASITRISNKVSLNTRYALELLRDLEEVGLARVFSTPSRICVTLTKEGEKTVNELVKTLSAPM
ncbi:MAG: hypothetical protein QW291_02390 [Thermofilaceae archaeon]